MEVGIVGALPNGVMSLPPRWQNRLAFVTLVAAAATGSYLGQGDFCFLARGALQPNGATFGATARAVRGECSSPVF